MKIERTNAARWQLILAARPADAAQPKSKPSRPWREEPRTAQIERRALSLRTLYKNLPIPPRCPLAQSPSPRAAAVAAARPPPQGLELAARG